MKFACIFDIDFADREKNSYGINGITKYQILDAEEVMQKWNEMTRKKIQEFLLYQYFNFDEWPCASLIL